MRRRESEPVTGPMEEFRRYTAEKLKLGICQRVSREVLDDMSLEVLGDAMVDQFIFQLRAFLWSREVKEEIEGRRLLPVTWWDHAKQRLRERFPRSWGRWVRIVRTEEMVTTRKIYHTCPHLNVDPQHKHLDWMVRHREDVRF